MLVNAVFGKEPSSAKKCLLHAFEAVFVMRKDPGRKAASGALKNPFHEKSSADGRIIKKRSEQRGKSDFWLPDSSKTGRAVSKVEQNLQKSEKCSTAGSKSGPRDLESRTKSPKIEKMFYR